MTNPRSGLISKKLKDKQQATQDNDELAQDLEKTELGQSYLDHKKTIIVSMLAIIVLAITGSLWFQNRHSSRNEFASLLNTFRLEKLNAFKDKKLKWEEFRPQVEEFLNKHGKNDATGIIYAEVANTLIENNMTEEAISILQRGKASQRGNTFLNLIFDVTLASLLENQGKVDEALKLLEGLAAHEIEIMRDKVNYDLGRIYLSKGQADQAKQKFEEVAKGPNANDILVKMANLHLEKLNAVKTPDSP